MSTMAFEARLVVGQHLLLERLIAGVGLGADRIDRNPLDLIAEFPLS